LTLIAASAVAEAAQPHGKHHPLSKSSGQHSVRPFKHQSGSVNRGMKPSGSHKVVIAHCDPGPCKGSKPHNSPSHPVVITHCDPGPCKGNKPHHPPPVITHCDPLPCKGKPNKETHHRPPHWPPFGHRQHAEYRERNTYGYRPGGYDRPQPRYVYPTSYAPRPTYAYAPAPAAQSPAASCLSKEYLNNGPVLFKDTCTQEWAMGEASPARGLNVGCLRKEYLDGGVVKFSDICTKEWATNAPAEQQAAAPTAAQEDDEDDD
jgi:hypothetical protein